MKRLWFILPLALLAAILLAACAQGPAPTADPTLTANPELPVYKDPLRTVDERTADLLARMSLEEKLGQMTQVENGSIAPGDITASFIGSILSGGGGIPAANYLEGWANMTAGYQREALATRLGIPEIYGIDAVHGIGHFKGATIFPHNIGLGATRNPDLVYRIGQATAEEMLAIGTPWNFGPVVAVPQDIRWGRTYEGFGEDSALVSELGAAYIRGLQEIPTGVTPAPGQTIGVLADPKHFLGDGGTVFASSHTVNGGIVYLLDQGNMQVDEAALRELYLPPYAAAVEDGAMCVMVSFSSWNGTKMHAQKYLITYVLKGELNFQGFVVSDWGGIDQIAPDDYYLSVVTAVNAGVDMNMVPSNYFQFLAVMKQAVEKGDITIERIDDAVTRILRVKFLLGLFDHPYADEALQATIRSDAHLEVARQAVRESLVLLKNENAALPLVKDASAILVAGRGADNTGLQSGGWTLGWQGTPYSDVAGSTILDGIQAQADPGTRVLYRSSGIFDDYAGTAPFGIVVVAEQPYAEGYGDAADLTLPPEDAAMIDRMRVKVDKLIVVIVSGRPLVITNEFQTADAWVAAWLPGSEGAAVADVLFGDFPFTGRTPYSWPRSNEQLPINVNNSAGAVGCAAPLFPYGYGQGEGGSTPIAWIDCL